MNSRVVKATSKGQVTLPSEWRNSFPGDDFLMKIEANRVIITPAIVEDLGCEEILFDAQRDNNGNGIPLDDLIQLLKDSDNG
jgi:bifunctional DNA-binding transcriptional regulator/antitoxin component of YhaV-PrlF toxin-antitoxin module